MNRSQKSPKSGLSIAFKESFVAASTLTYNCKGETRILSFTSISITNHEFNLESHKTWVIGFSDLIFSGNCAFVTRKVEILLLCSSSTSAFIPGYIIGSPTRDNAQWRGERPSDNRSKVTPTGRVKWASLETNHTTHEDNDVQKGN